MSNNKTPRPFLKWAGGKTRIIPHLQDLFPSGKFNYYEPFLGGGSVYFSLFRSEKLVTSYLNDLNQDLIGVYLCIKNKCEDLINELEKTKYSNDLTTYRKIRALNPSNLSDVESSARFIYLNKTCFNGLYRVNNSGIFNVPYGKYKNPTVLDKQNFRAVSDSLQNATFSCQDFEVFLKNVNPGSVVYFDPPYMPISDKGNFTNYTSAGFTLKDHERLRDVFFELSKNDIVCILSNSYKPETVQMYSNGNVMTLMGNRNIGGSPDSRKSVKEIIVTSK